jgi:hypothetical protein
MNAFSQPLHHHLASGKQARKGIRQVGLVTNSEYEQASCPQLKPTAAKLINSRVLQLCP